VCCDFFCRPWREFSENRSRKNSIWNHSWIETIEDKSIILPLLDLLQCCASEPEATILKRKRTLLLGAGNLRLHFLHLHLLPRMLIGSSFALHFEHIHDEFGILFALFNFVFFISSCD
jgi:hypothetical protein